jgi:hypothetical protein
MDERAGRARQESHWRVVRVWRDGISVVRPFAPRL